MQRLTLEFAPAGSWVALRGLSGQDEESVTGTDTAQAIALLDRLLVTVRGAALGPGNAADLAAPDRDRLLAAVYAPAFGPRVECVVRCEDCGERLAVDFVLADLVASLPAADHVAALARREGAVLHFADGRRVRLPCGRDELDLLAVAPEWRQTELLRRCVVEGDVRADDATVLAAMEAAGPLVDLDLDSTCPACGATRQVHFDLQFYLLSAILQETPLRTAEIHRLAATYGWGLGEILALARTRRRALVAEIERERSFAQSTRVG